MFNPRRDALLISAISLFACSSPQPTPANDATMNGDTIAADATDATVDTGPVYYLPSGYMMTPFLSTEPVLDFASPGPVLESGQDYEAVIETDVGRIVLDLNEVQTPNTVNSFVWLSLHHFYDGIAFHRVIAGFMAQTGDPNTLDPDTSAWGSGGPGYGYGLEIVPSLTYDGAGVVGMARTSNPNSNGSQFFITFAAQHSLDGMYTVFARVSEGMEVLALIARSPRDGVPPENPTRMQRVYIVQRTAVGRDF